MISIFSKVFLPLTQKWKHLSLYPLATSDWEIPLNSSHLCRSLFWLWVILPVTRVDLRLLWENIGKDGLYYRKYLNNWVYIAYFGGKRWMIWKLYTPGICNGPEKHLMNVHRRSRSRHRPLPLASICYHVPLRHCVLPWKIENRTAVTAEHCSWQCRAAIMSNL